MSKLNPRSNDREVAIDESALRQLVEPSVQYRLEKHPA
jgi:hypothetical protein